MVFSDSLSNVDGLAVKICGPSVHHGISAYIINDINRGKVSRSVPVLAWTEVATKRVEIWTVVAATNCVLGSGPRVAKLHVTISQGPH
jgi:hypothetical protein